MIEKATSASSIASMLQTLKSHAAQASGVGVDGLGGQTVSKSDFSDMVRKAVKETNSLQLDSQETNNAFERGEQVPLTDVVLKMQKASLSFEATLQVRNKVLKAYEDIMNMPV
jgi:flagellar hook-basal body complex protein FliE